jgi:hypothetical protein
MTEAWMTEAWMDLVVAERGDGAVVQMLPVGLAQGPGLQLMHGAGFPAGIMVTCDLGQFGSMAPPIALMRPGPGEVFAGRAVLAGGIGRQGQGHRRQARWRGVGGHGSILLLSCTPIVATSGSNGYRNYG